MTSVGPGRDIEAMARSEASGDGTVEFSRTEACHQEMLRQGVNAEDLRSEREALNAHRQALSKGNLRPALTAREQMILRAADVPAILRGWAVIPLEDKILVKYASFKEGYVCETCQGSGHSDKQCPACEGKREVPPREGWAPRPCTVCTIVGAENRPPRACGFTPCPACGGSGLAPGILAIPDESKQDHS